ncbi:MAG: sulfatase, partial [Planctomycetota bacterium]|nr:sulfatase [Planctomycetota bacterium]
MNPLREAKLIETRRHFFGRTAAGIGTAALSSLLNPDLFSAESPPQATVGGLPGLPHFAPKAKRVIYLFMSGAPSQLDM